jgi:actin-related protein 8
VVIALGSSQIHVGRADAKKPFSRPNAIAFRRKSLKPEAEDAVSALGLTPEDELELRAIQGQAAQDKECAILSKKFARFCGPPQKDVVEDLVFPRATGDVISGEAVFLCDPSEYKVVFPFRHGRLAIGSALAPVLEQQTLIIRDALTEDLRLTPRECAKLSCSLCVPDQLNAREIRELCDIVIKRLGFGEVFLHQESVLSCFGAGMASACVVDIGAQKSRVTCVEDGIVIPNTSFCLPYGGDDVTDLLLTLLKKPQGALSSCHLESMLDKVQLDELKRRGCHLWAQDTTIPVFKGALWQHSATESGQRHNFTMSSEACIAPLLLFNTSLLNPARILHAPAAQTLHCLRTTDSIDSLRAMVAVTMPKSRSTTEGFQGLLAGAGALTGSALLLTTPVIVRSASAPDGMTPLASSTFSAPPTTPITIPNSSPSLTPLPSSSPAKDSLPSDEEETPINCQRILNGMLTLQDAVTCSIKAVPSDETRRLLATKILLVGGSSDIPGLVDHFEDMLVGVLP